MEQKTGKLVNVWGKILFLYENLRFEQQAIVISTLMLEEQLQSRGKFRQRVIVAIRQLEFSGI